MAARSHFVFPIDAKKHKVLVIWDQNGYGEYEFDWCICDKALACGGGTKNIIPPENFGDIITYIRTTTNKAATLWSTMLLHRCTDLPK